MTYCIKAYELTLEARQTVSLPTNAQLLHVDSLDGQLFLWALVDDAQPKNEYRAVAIFATGQEVPLSVQHWVHLGTLMNLDDIGIAHIFEARA